ncbi:LamG-like jellyroll fold domain-containing protein [Nocardioides terrisoli]|uniref:LamG-like jellyroll fold domain-containing protein n=1 Tax=Nocardioides terrisoli TaxID=3388267 RepID=UPI00287B9D2E|nr:MBG domain-containing protein [Nocardioides marmorisolisilvae]
MARPTRSHVRLITAGFLSAAMAAALVACWSGTPADAQAAPLGADPAPFTSITVHTSPSYGGADATYTIGFTTPSDGVLGGFSMHAPDGTTLPSDASDYTITDGTTSYAVEQAAVGSSGSTENILVQTGHYLPASTTLTMTIDHVTNPAGCDCVLYLNADNGSGDVASPHYTILGGYPAAVLSDHPARYYRLGEAAGATIAKDLSDSDTDGTYQPAATLGTTGALPTDDDTAAATDGTGPVTTASDTGLPSGKSARTVEGWIRMPDGGTGNAVLVDYGTSSGAGQSVEIDVVGGGNQIDQNYDYGGVGWTTPYGLEDGQWHLIDWVDDGAGHDTVYVDGDSLGTKSDGGTNTNLAGDDGLRIGNGFDTHGAAEVDEVAIYPTALSEARVRAHLAASVQGPNPPTGLTAESGTNLVTASWTTSAVDATHAAPPSYHVRVTDDHGKVVADTTRSRGALCQDGSCTLALDTIPAGEYVVSVAGRDSQWQGPATSAATGTVSGATDEDRYAASVLADGPSVYYRLDEQSGATRVQDISGNEVDGHYASAGTLAQPGALPNDGDQAVHADGSGPALTANDAALPMARTARTVEGWVRLPEDGTGNAVIVDYGTSAGSGQTVEIGVVSHGNVINQNWDYGGLNWSTPYSLEDGQWHLVDWVDDGAGHDTVYLDGVSLGTKADTGTNTQPAGIRGLRIGDGFDTHGPADLDEVAIYPTALSATRVRAHLAASVQGPNAPTDLDVQGGVNRVSASWTASAVDPTHVAPTSYRMVVHGPDGVAADTTRSAGDLCAGSSCTLTVRSLAAGSYTVTVAGRYDDRQGPGTSGDVDVTGADDSSAYAHAVLRDGPSVYYRLDEPAGSAVAQDSAGDDDARYQSPAQLGVAAPASFQGDTAAATDGSGPIATASDLDLPGGSTARTVEGWVRLPDGGTGNAVIVDYGTSDGGGRTVELDVVADGNQIDQNWDYGGVGWTTPYNLEDGQWHLVDWVDDGAGYDTVYLDGVSLGTQGDSGTNTQLAGIRGLRIGEGFDTRGPAALDEVAIYPTALSGDQVARHYAVGTQTITTSHDQTITFTAPTGLAYGAAKTALDATASSGLPVTYASNTPEVCDVDTDGNVLVLAAGPCSITASQDGDTDYDAAPSVTRAFDIAQAPLTITASDESMTAGDTPPTPTASYDGFVNGDSADSLTTKPTCVSDLDQEKTSCSGATDSNYDIGYVDGTLTVNPAAKQDQTITFPNPPNVMYGGVEDLHATASSKLLVSYASDDHTVCTVDDQGHLTATGAGTCVVTASQAGDADYNAAPSVEQSVHVDRTALTISASDATMTAGGPLPTVTPTYSGFVAHETAASLTKQPTCVAVPTEKKTRCSGAEDPNYDIGYVDGTLTIRAKQAQTITIHNLPTLTYSRSRIAVQVTSTSGLRPALSAGPLARCSIGGSHTLLIHGAGRCRITATQAGNDDYSAATRTMTVTIRRVSLEVDAPNELLVSGLSATPTIAPTYDGFVRGDDVTALSHPARCSIVHVTVRKHHHKKRARVTRCRHLRSANYVAKYVDGHVGTASLDYAFYNASQVYWQSGKPTRLNLRVVHARHTPRARVEVEPNAGKSYGLPPGMHYVKRHHSISRLVGSPTSPGTYFVWLRAYSSKKAYLADQVIRIDVY